MRAQTLSPVAGWGWILTGFAIFRRNPITLGMLVLTYWFTVVFLNVLPYVGALLASLVIPGGGVVRADGGLDRGALRDRILADPAERAALEEADFITPALFVMALMTPVMMAYWFAPVLAAWHRLTLGRALFFSFVACWMNWRAFLVYGAGLLLAAGVIPGVLLGLLMLLFPDAANFITAIVTMPMVLVIAPTIFASFYACYRDIFGISEIV